MLRLIMKRCEKEQNRHQQRINLKGENGAHSAEAIKRHNNADVAMKSARTKKAGNAKGDFKGMHKRDR